MTSIANPESQRTPIWRNVRFISWSFQLVVAAIVGAILLWLYNNYRVKTAASGIPTSFDFLNNPTSFEIPGNSLKQTQPLRDAYIQGALNTLRVVVAGLLMATVLGTLIGIGRLSGNWVIRQISTVYVEVIRNLPLLALFVFIFIVGLQTFPKVQEAWTPLDLAVVSNRGIGVPWFEGGSGTLLTLLFAVGLIGWFVLSKWRASVSAKTGALARTGLWGGSFFLLTLIVGWFALGFGWTVPAVDGRRLEGGISIDPSYFVVLVALVVYTASHIAEIVRGSIQAVPKGQGEAGNALALSGFQRMWYVVLPQAFRIAIPPLGNQYLNLIKNSSIAAGYSYFEITNIAQTAQGGNAPAVPAFTLALLFYLAFSFVTSGLVNLANRKFKLVER